MKFVIAVLAFAALALATPVPESANDVVNQGQYQVSAQNCTIEQGLDPLDKECYLLPVPGGHTSPDDPEI
ncbi:UNVERIFIED_CONTAM: hypothetical protein HDU68_007311 [Siphonaria sp. JEL0065]|nr:hypothetical protein HDU68_007311 [Siphonaria sp. JEL0065]